MNLESKMADYRSKVELLKEQMQVNSDQKFKIGELEREITAKSQQVINEQRAQNSFKEELMRTKEMLSEKSLKVKALETDVERLRDVVQALESKMYKKED